MVLSAMRFWAHWAWLCVAFAGGCDHQLQFDGDDLGALNVDLGTNSDGSGLGRRERCNGIDDDLDGKIDEGCPIRLTTDPADDTYPTLSNGRVAWRRAVDNAVGYTQTIWARDLPLGGRALGAEIRLGDGDFPWLSGDRIAFRNLDADQAYSVVSLPSNTSTRIPAMGAEFTQRSRLASSWLVWSQTASVGSESYSLEVYDLLATTRRTLATVGAFTFPDQGSVDGSSVFWIQDGKLWTADLATGEAPHVLAGVLAGRTAWQFVVGGGRLVVKERTADTEPLCQSVLIDRQTGARTELEPLKTVSSDCALPWFSAVSGRFAAGARSSSAMWLTDLTTLKAYQVTSYFREVGEAALDGSTLVWTDDRNDSFDLFMMDLSDFDAGDFYPEGLTP